MNVIKLNIVRTNFSEFQEEGYSIFSENCKEPVKKTNKSVIVKKKKGLFSSHYYEVVTRLEIPVLLIELEMERNRTECFEINGLIEDTYYYGAIYEFFDKNSEEIYTCGEKKVSYVEVEKYLKDHENVDDWKEELMRYFYPAVLRKQEEAKRRQKRKTEEKSIKKLIKKFNAGQNKI